MDTGVETSGNGTQPVSPSAAAGWTVRLNPRTLWLAAAIGIAVLLAIVILNHVFNIVVLVFLAIVFAEGIRPLVMWLHRWKIPRPLGTALVYLLLFAALGGVGYILATPLISQSAAFINNLPTYANRGQELLTRVQAAVHSNLIAEQALQTLKSQGGNLVGQVVTFLLRLPVSIITGLFYIIFILTVAFFWVNSIDALKPFVVSLLPGQIQVRAAHVIDEAAHRLSWYVRGLLVNMVFIGVTHTLGLLVLGVPYPLLLGVFAGITEAIPFAGPFIAGAVAMAVALFAVGPGKCLEVFVLVVAIQQFESNVLVPNVMNRTVKLHPLAVVIAVVVGGELYGILGAILAVPVAVILDILVEDMLAPLARHVSAQVEERQQIAAAQATPETPADSAAGTGP